MDPLTACVLGLATWRLSSLLVVEDGPWRVFRRIRRWARAGEWSQKGMDGNRLCPAEVQEVMMNAGRSEGFFSGLLSCIWCTSVWVAAGLALGFFLLPVPAFYFALVFALSSVAILIERIV